MDIGRIGVLVGLVSSILAIAAYAWSLRGDRRLLWAARVFYGITSAAVVFCFARLMFLVVNKQFQYDYVHQFVSVDLHGKFLYAATWAGQQGSFLLWALWTAVIGGLVAWKAGKWEARVMPFYVSVLTFLFAILHLLSPYAIIARGGANGWPLDAPCPPPNGNGLNPSLQNYWMAIHPPTIFFGFASLAVPFTYAIAAMLWREYGSWAKRVMPWTLLTAATLGVGLFMGGYWAYETQGWHGFWGWDPVENASLFPFLGALALVHGLVVQRSRGGMGRTNLMLAVASWMLFLYGTFLTRSGALASFSVHAFGAEDNPALKLLPWMVYGYGLLGAALLAWRWRGIPGRPISDKFLSRDTAMVTAVTLMVIAAAVVALGTSWPLVSRWTLTRVLLHSLYSPRGMRVEPVFYNKIGSVLLIPALLAMGVVPYLAWGKTNAEKLLWKLLAPWFAAVGLGFGILAFVWHEAAAGFRPDTPPMLVVATGTLGIFAALANIALAIRVLRSKAVTAGGWMAHVGIGLLFAGTVITNVYERTQTFNLVEGRPPLRTQFGYALQFAGWTHDDKLKRASDTSDPREAAELRHEVMQHDWWSFDHAVKIKVIPIVGGPGVAQADDTDPHAGLGLPNPHGGMTGIGGKLDERGSFVARAPVFHNQQLMQNDDPESPQTMRWPYIHVEPLRDFYISVASDPKEKVATATLRPGETATVGIPELMMLSNYQVEYKSFYREGEPGQPGTVFGANLVLHAPDGRAIPLKPGLRIGGPAGPEPVNLKIPGLAGAVELEGGVNAATKEITAEFLLPEMPSVWVVPIAVTNKPMIGLVWIGVILMGLGALTAMVRRSLEARKDALIETAAASGLGQEGAATAGESAARQVGGNGTAGDADRGRRRSRRPAPVGK